MERRRCRTAGCRFSGRDIRVAVADGVIGAPPVAGKCTLSNGRVDDRDADARVLEKSLSTRPEPQVPHLPTGLAVGLGLESTLDRISILRPDVPESPAQWFPRSRFRGIW